MAERDEIEALLARVENATGPDREIDEDLHVLVSGATREDQQSGRHAYHKDGFWVSIGVVLAYTASLDAIVGLIERELPGWTIAGVGQNDSKKWHCELRDGFQTSYKRVVIAPKPHYGAPNGALAATAAFLRAKLASEPSP